MAAAQVARTFWLSSRCARSELNRPLTTARPFLHVRIAHASSSVFEALSDKIHVENCDQDPTISVEEEAPKKSKSTKAKVEGKGDKPIRKRARPKAEVDGDDEARPRKGRGPGKKTISEGREGKLRRRNIQQVEGDDHPNWTTIGLEEDDPNGVPFLHLPPSNRWMEIFKGVIASHKRPTIKNPETARLLAERFIPEGSRDKIVIEASPGPGQLSRALLNLPRERIKKLILIEPVGLYYQCLKPLEKLDDRVTVVQLSGRDWSTYTEIERMGLLKDVEIADWDQVHPHLHFIMQMGGGVDGELVGAQLLRTIPDRQWLFNYGRIPMHLILTDRMYERLKAPENVAGIKSNNIRCKVSVMTQAVSHLSEAVPRDVLQPYWDHFHPERFNQEEDKTATTLDSRRPGNPRVALEVIPFAHPLIRPGDLDYWDYVARKLFVVKARPLEAAINALGPGAYNILNKLVRHDDPDNSLDIQKNPRELNIHDWHLIVEAFKSWPFRPTNLGIEQMLPKRV